MHFICKDIVITSTFNKTAVLSTDRKMLTCFFPLILPDKDGKAFHPTYEEKLRLVALHKQVLLGPYNPDASPDVGFFDVLGNDRR